MANENKEKIEYVDAKYNTRTTLIGLWVVLILLYIYCDHFSFFRTGEIERIISGFIGPFKITQISLILSSLITIIPSLTIVACLFVNPNILRYINIIVGILFTLVNIGNIVGETWAYYLMYGIIEIVITVLIIIISIRWKKKI